MDAICARCIVNFTFWQFSWNSKDFTAAPVLARYLAKRRMPLGCHSLSTEFSIAASLLANSARQQRVTWSPAKQNTNRSQSCEIRERLYRCGLYAQCHFEIALVQTGDAISLKDTLSD